MRLYNRKPYGKWHTWYAWYPVFCDCGTLVWLEPVQRFCEIFIADTLTKYKLKEPK